MKRLNRTRLRLAATKTAQTKWVTTAITTPKTVNKSNFYSHDDPLGSYTGTSTDGEVIQDADDL